MNQAIQPGLERPPQAAVAPQLSIIIPTFNERDNVTRITASAASGGSDGAACPAPASRAF
jgi:hypothetical protein